MFRKPFFFLAAILLLARFNATVGAEISAITKDGQEVILSDDGTWSYSKSSNSDMGENSFPFTCRVIGETAGGFFFDGLNWQPISKDQVFATSVKLKYSEKSSLEVELPKGNKTKLFSESIVEIFSPEGSKSGEFAQMCNLESGEANFEISLDGRDFLTCRVIDGKVRGLSGLFKIIFDPKNQNGEVVVKNGLVEVITCSAQDHKKLKISGFYKSIIDNGKFSIPAQASIITYIWR